MKPLQLCLVFLLLLNAPQLGLTLYFLLQCICQCPMKFEDAAAPAPSAGGMAGGMMHQAQADLADNMDSMMGSGCGPTPTQYEPFTQVSKHCADHLPSQH